MTEERVQSDGSQKPLSLEKRPVCQAELFQAKSTKVLPSRSVEYEINFIFYRIQHAFYTNATETGLQVTGYQFCHPATAPLAQVHSTLCCRGTKVIMQIGLMDQEFAAEQKFRCFLYIVQK